jgi:DNA-binding NarL/FixJ family response regulator
MPVAVHRAVLMSESPLLRIGMRALIGRCRAVQVAAELDSHHRLARAVEAVRGQLVVVAPADGGSEALFRTLDGLPPGCRVVILLALPGFKIQSNSLRQTYGFTCLPLDVDPHELEACVRATLREPAGGLEVQELCTGPGGTLTPREQEVLHELALGRSNREISEALVVSEDTVKSHLRKTYRKLGVSTRAEAVSLFVGQLGSP